MMERVEQQLGNYRLKQVLGKGAFADVYLGEHLYLNTPAAVKVLHSRQDSPTLADFLTEARHISHLVHPHIIRVFDFGLESDVPFLVMDYAPHGNLRQKHPPGMTVPLSLVVNYTVALASALQHAHDQHLVHRDIKPELDPHVSLRAKLRKGATHGKRNTSTQGRAGQRWPAHPREHPTSPNDYAGTTSEAHSWSCEADSRGSGASPWAQSDGARASRSHAKAESRRKADLSCSGARRVGAA